jgi:hypothetical protein
MVERISDSAADAVPLVRGKMIAIPEFRDTGNECCLPGRREYTDCEIAACTLLGPGRQTKCSTVSPMPRVLSRPDKWSGVRPCWEADRSATQEPLIRSE